MASRRKAERDEDEEESGRVLKTAFQNPFPFRQISFPAGIFSGTAGCGSLHMFLEDGAGHADRPVDLLLLFL